jgi:hypothetical protein
MDDTSGISYKLKLAKKIFKASYKHRTNLQNFFEISNFRLAEIIDVKINRHYRLRKSLRDLAPHMSKQNFCMQML